MKRIFLAFAMPLALCACNPASIGVGNAPAPLQQTVIDEKGIITAYQAFDVALTAVDELVRLRVIVPGSARALSIKGYLTKAQTALNAARSAQRAGSTTDYATAMLNATDALRQASAILRKGN